MTTKTLDLNNIERKIFWVLSTALAVVLAFYLYGALVITIAGVDRNKMNRTAHELASQASMLEAEYLSQSNSVTLAYAQNLGFQEVTAKYTNESGEKVAMAR